MKVKNILAIAVFTIASTTSFAQNKISSIANDKARIKQGAQSGELTRLEAARLRAQTAQVQQERNAYKSDGVITTAERKDLRQDKRQLSRRIYKQKHDCQKRR
jgi:hypothetical protein